MKIYPVVISYADEASVIKTFYSEKEASNFISQCIGNSLFDNLDDKEDDNAAFENFIDDIKRMDYYKNGNGDITYIRLGSSDFYTQYEVLEQEIDLTKLNEFKS